MNGTYVGYSEDSKLPAEFNRNVWLFATPDVAIRDFFATTDLDEEYKDAVFNLELKVKNSGKTASAEHTVLYSIADQTETVAVPSLKPGEERTLSSQIKIENPRKWTAETPNLYPLILKLKNGGDVKQITGTEFGFREVEIKGNIHA